MGVPFSEVEVRFFDVIATRLPVLWRVALYGPFVTFLIGTRSALRVVASARRQPRAE
jgi:hypothetical protein